MGTSTYGALDMHVVAVELSDCGTGTLRVLLEDDAANHPTIHLGYTIVGSLSERRVTDADVDSEALVRYVDATGATNTNEPIGVSIEELAESPAPQPHVIRASFRIVGSGWDHSALVLDGTFCEWLALLC